MVLDADVEAFIAERTRRRAEVEEFTKNLPSVTPAQLPAFSLTLPRGADEDVPCNITSRRTERNFRKRYARTHRCRERMNAGDQYKSAQYYEDLDHLNFGFGTSPQKLSVFKVYGYAEDGRGRVLRNTYSYPAGKSIFL